MGVQEVPNPNHGGGSAPTTRQTPAPDFSRTGSPRSQSLTNALRLSPVIHGAATTEALSDRRRREATALPPTPLRTLCSLKATRDWDSRQPEAQLAPNPRVHQARTVRVATCCRRVTRLRVIAQIHGLPYSSCALYPRCIPTLSQSSP
jgi:hypothetical protein